MRSLRLSVSKRSPPVKVNIDFRYHKAAFNHAVNWGLLTENPFLKCNQLRVPQKRPAYLTKEDFQLLMSVIDLAWYREIVRFALSPMMRLGERVSLKWSSVDLQKRLIYIENSDSFRAKTLKSRVIPMDELTYLALMKKLHDSEFVFTWPNGRPFAKEWVTHKFKVYCRKIGIEKKFTFIHRDIQERCGWSRTTCPCSMFRRFLDTQRSKSQK